ncbi:uncharacterized protein LY89DRAFT_595908 [Mollisia scopiformis]|uniref:BTB domain-containing protein n=1 Tax=Mollisia scopiformis TaxID=149040 RepID=A0A194WRM1_MOLSC|nr:uncharacterized protein LY89DRAFT_595908 [Mollisia scopiformis]KUJ10645.1 hypothetical protein LY89DRAFT_595908 [Mollisia scopiformis]
MVDILVGPEQELFRVHLKILPKKVAYFQKMFSSGFKEAVERKAYLPEDSPEAFHLFLEWLYIENFRTSDKADGKDGLRVKVYCLAEKICQPDLMDYTISSIISNLDRDGRILLTSTMLSAYKSSDPDSKLRKFVARCFFYALYSDPNSNGDWNIEELSEAMNASQDLCRDALTLVRDLLQYGGSRVDPRRLAKCTFHTHEKGAACSYKGDVP